jgi:hypothetical protein
MNRADPNIGNVESGNEANPQAGKTATTAILAAKSSDVLTNDELQMVAMNLKDRNERKLWMRQQQEGIDQYKISGQYMRTEALTEKYGKTAVCSIEAMELQQEIDVEPEAMSILSVDDELKRNSAQTLYMMAKEDPINFNSNYAAQTFAKTIRGVDVAKAVNPPAPPAGPEVRITASVPSSGRACPPKRRYRFCRVPTCKSAPKMLPACTPKRSCKALPRWARLPTLPRHYMNKRCRMQPTLAT